MRLGSTEIQYLNALQSISKTLAKDCVYNENTITFLVPAGQMGIAIGKGGTNAKKLREILHKNVEFFEFQKTAENFVKNAFNGVQFTGFENSQDENGKAILVAKIDPENKQKLLLNPGKIKRLKELAKRNYEINDIKIGK